MIRPLAALLLQIGAALAGATFLYSAADKGEMPAPYLWMLAGFALTYIALAPFIQKLLQKTGDSFYLVFMGISGIRFLFFLGILTILLLFNPEVKSTKLAMVLTSWFVIALAIEVMVFLTNLRHISKNQT